MIIRWRYFGEYGGWSKISQFMSYAVYFFTSSATCERAFSWSIISLSWRLANSSRFFQYSIQFHQFLFIVNSCDRFSRFQKLVVYHTFLIPLNTQHHLLSMKTAFWGLWTWFTWQYPHAFYSLATTFSSTFLKIKAKKQSFPHMLFRWFKTWHFRCYKNVVRYYKWIYF